MNKYEDIINEPRHISSSHPPMKAESRAAQFAPFAALAGFSEEIDEEGRLTESRPVLSPDQEARLNEAISVLHTRISDNPEAEISFFVPDKKKNGGSVRTLSCRLRYIDMFRHLLILTDGEALRADMITDVKIIENKIE